MNPLYRNKDWLYIQYFELNKSCRAIANEFGFKHVTVYKWFKIFGFVARKNGQSLLGNKPHNFKGLHKAGKYLGRYDPKHPNSDKYGRIYEHRYVMSNHIGRPLKDKEVVHHINGDTKDNRIQNLQLVESPGIHSRDYHNHIPNPRKS